MGSARLFLSQTSYMSTPRTNQVKGQLSERLFVIWCIRVISIYGYLIDLLSKISSLCVMLSRKIKCVTLGDRFLLILSRIYIVSCIQNLTCLTKDCILWSIYLGIFVCSSWLRILLVSLDYLCILREYIKSQCF